MIKNNKNFYNNISHKDKEKDKNICYNKKKK